MQVRDRILLLTHEFPSLSVWNVWDLPLWAWRQYAAFTDEKIKQTRAGA